MRCDLSSQNAPLRRFDGRRKCVRSESNSVETHNASRFVTDADSCSEESGASAAVARTRVRAAISSPRREHVSDAVHVPTTRRSVTGCARARGRLAPVDPDRATPGSARSAVRSAACANGWQANPMIATDAGVGGCGAPRNEPNAPSR